MISTTSNGIKFQKGAGLSGYVAEIGSALVCACLGIVPEFEPRPDHAAYVASGLCGKLANDSPTISARSSPLRPMRSARWLICTAFSRRRRASERRPDVSCSVRARGGRCALPDRPVCGFPPRRSCIPPCSSRTLRWRRGGALSRIPVRDCVHGRSLTTSPPKLIGGIWCGEVASARQARRQTHWRSCGSNRDRGTEIADSGDPFAGGCGARTWLG